MEARMLSIPFKPWSSWRTLRRGVLSTMLVAWACGGTPSGPEGEDGTAGVVEVSLTGAQSDDGAVLLSVGGAVTNVAAARSDVEVFSRTGSQSTSVAVFGALAGGALVRVSVSDVGALPTFTVQDVSANDGELRPSLTGYAVAVTVQ